jgi:class I fructose-bisphosphate aldolase
MGAVAVGATIYFGSPESTRQIQEVSEAFQQAHELGMATVLWCYLRNPAFKTAEKDFHVSADLTGQANHLGSRSRRTSSSRSCPRTTAATSPLHQGEPVRQDRQVGVRQAASDNPIDWTRYQVANCYMGRAGLINSGGASSGESDFRRR